MIALALCLALVPGDPELVFDLSPFEPPGVGGEVWGISSATGQVTHARVDATFESHQESPWSVFANFLFPTGIVGVASETEDWTGIGTFTATIESEALDGQLGLPTEGSFFSWFLDYGSATPFELPGGGTGLGPMDGIFTELVLTLTLCDVEDTTGPWSDEGHALGTPRLVGTGCLCAGEPGALDLSDAPPGALAYLVVGFSSVALPFHGGVLVPSPDLLVAGLPIDRAGQSALPFVWPAGVPGDIELWFQEWIPDPAGPQGWSASNAVKAIAP